MQIREALFLAFLLVKKWVSTGVAFDCFYSSILLFNWLVSLMEIFPPLIYQSNPCLKLSLNHFLIPVLFLTSVHLFKNKMHSSHCET